MIVATLGIRVAPENTRRAMQVILPLLGPTHTESGCLSCDLYQGTEDDGSLILIERWESLPDLERHIRSDRYHKVLAWIEMSTEPPEIRFDFVSETRGFEMLEAVLG